MNTLPTLIQHTTRIPNQSSKSEVNERDSKSTTTSTTANAGKNAGTKELLFTVGGNVN
jgi:hypothetical protein